MTEVVRRRLPSGVKEIFDSYHRDSERMRMTEQMLSKNYSCQCQAALRVVSGIIHEGERVNISTSELCPPSSNCPPHTVLYAILNAMLTYLSQNKLYPKKVTLNVQDFLFVVNMHEGVLTVRDASRNDLFFTGGFGLRGRLWSCGMVSRDVRH